MRKVTCKICGKEFTTNHIRKVTCSDECSKKNQNNHAKKFMRKYKILHPEKVKAARIKYNMAHPDRVKESRKRYELTLYKRAIGAI